jgi:hypothetical protein
MTEKPTNKELERSIKQLERRVLECVRKKKEFNEGPFLKESKNLINIMEAKILGVADVVEAMASHRPYRPALSVILKPAYQIG